MKIQLTFQTKPLHKDAERVRLAIEAAVADGRITKKCRCDGISVSAATDPLGNHYAAIVKCDCGKTNTRLSGTTSEQ